MWNILPEQTFFAYSNSPIDTHNLFAGRVTSRSKKNCRRACFISNWCQLNIMVVSSAKTKLRLYWKIFLQIRTNILGSTKSNYSLCVCDMTKMRTKTNLWITIFPMTMMVCLSYMLRCPKPLPKMRLWFLLIGVMNLLSHMESPNLKSEEQKTN